MPDANTSVPAQALLSPVGRYDRFLAEFAPRFARLMDASGRTADEIGDVLAVGGGVVHRWRRGEGMPGACMLPPLAALLNVSVAALYGEPEPEVAIIDIADDDGEGVAPDRADDLFDAADVPDGVPTRIARYARLPDEWWVRIGAATPADPYATATHKFPTEAAARAFVDSLPQRDLSPEG